MARKKTSDIDPPTSTQRLLDVVSIDRRFHRSIRIDQDLGNDAALEGYILQQSTLEVIQEISRTLLDTKQRAFTLTGPYGGGKSSLALVLGDFVSSNSKCRESAELLLGAPLTRSLRKAFPIKKGGWFVLPVQGRKSNPISDIARALADASGTPSLRKIDTEKYLLHSMAEVATAKHADGVLLIIDELGKFLESIADGSGDIHFFQELAESACRSEKPIVVLGILHQAFDGYVSKFGRGVRDEWAKVQGRYVDIPFRSAPDETLHLLGKAIHSDRKHPDTLPITNRISKQIRSRRFGAPENLEANLEACWPLHPLVPFLLGAFSKRRFGQNERSIFGFLTSQEPHGFQSFLRSEPSTGDRLYSPSHFWDYLRTNLEPIILASHESHRWSTAVQTIERAESTGSELQVEIAKTIAVMDYFSPGDPGADLETIHACIPNESEKSIREALQALESASAVIYRKHLKSWAAFAGSDFDITAALSETKHQSGNIDLARLSRLAPIGPIIAKRHYQVTGAFRWFSFDIVKTTDLEIIINQTDKSGRSGRFLLVLPTNPEESDNLEDTCQTISSQYPDKRVIIGAPVNAGVILDLGLELLALHQINGSDPRLAGDEVARREVLGHIADIDQKLEYELHQGFISARWFLNGKPHLVANKDSLTTLASGICSEWFCKAPDISSELVNRHRPTRNSQAGVRELLRAMVKNPSEIFLGIEGYSAERGLYDTVLANAGLHRELPNGEFGFTSPCLNSKNGNSYQPFWEEGDTWLRDLNDLAPLTELLDKWAAPPYGVHRGVMPILALAFLLSHKEEIAIHSEGVFQTEEDLHIGTFVDCLYRDAALIQVRFVPAADPERQRLLVEIAQGASTAFGRSAPKESLVLAQHLKGFSDRLHPWVHKTKELSKPAIALRQLLQKASDPNKLLFEDLPEWHQSNEAELPLRKVLVKGLRELGGAYEAMLRAIESTLWDALGLASPIDYQVLSTRAGRVHGVSGELRMDAFAGRLAELDGSIQQIEGLCGFAMNKPTQEWLGKDPNQARYRIIELADRFRKAETFADFCGREVGRQGLAIIVRDGKHYRTMIQYFDVGDEDQVRLEEIVSDFKRALNGSQLNSRLQLAALASITADILSTHSENEQQ